jgi:glycosyltransferase involved in cell wall biosynthesis
MKRILIITYYWPPSGGAGVQRWLKFSKYLPEFGVEPIVLTVDPEQASYAQKDVTLMNEVTCKVYTTPTFELYNLYKWIARKKEIPYGGFANEKKPGFAQKVMRALRSHLLLPDPRKGWNRHAYKKAAALIREFGIDTVVTTSPPHSTQLIGLKLKRNFGIRWVADLRDPWTDIYYYKDLYHSAFSKHVDLKLEKKVLLHADKVITVSKALSRIFEQKVPAAQAGKFFVIPNGFDISDFDYSIQPSSHKFTVAYTGTITGDYPIDAFLDALAELSETAKDLAVKFVGKTPTSIVAKVKEKGLEDVVTFKGYVPHNESVRCLMESHALLLIIPNVPNNEGVLTGKLFEYIGSARPIIAIGPVQGDAATIIAQSNSGQMFGYTNKESILAYLQQLYSQYKTGVRFQLSTENMQFSRKDLTSRLVAITSK